MKILFVLLLVILCAGCGGYSSPMVAAPQPGVVPVATELSPDNASAGAAGFVLTVSGSGFGTKAVVNWNGSQQPTTFVTANQLMAAIPATAIASSGSVPVTVTNPGTPASGGPYGNAGTKSETSMSLNFTVE
jgi:hypothetical protein